MKSSRTKTQNPSRIQFNLDNNTYLASPHKNIQEQQAMNNSSGSKNGKANGNGNTSCRDSQLNNNKNNGSDNANDGNFNGNVNGRDWFKVIEPITKYKRKSTGIDNPLNFYYQLQRMIQKGYKIQLNIPQTLTGTHDNYLQTIFPQDQPSQDLQQPKNSRSKTLDKPPNDKQKTPKQDQPTIPKPSKIEQIGYIKLTSSFSKQKFQAQAQKTIKQSIQKIRDKKMIENIFNQQEDSNNGNSSVNNNRILWLPFVVMKENIGNSYVISSASYINNSSSNINPNGSPTATSPTNNRRRARNSIMLDNKDKDQKVSSNKNMGECPTVKNTGKLIAGQQNQKRKGNLFKVRRNNSSDRYNDKDTVIITDNNYEGSNHENSNTNVNPNTNTSANNYNTGSSYQYYEQAHSHSTMIWNLYQYKKINNINTNQLSQVYIFTKNLTASITRYFHYGANYKVQRNSSNGNVVGVQNNNGNSGSSNIQITTNKYKNPKNVAYRIENNRSIISLQKNKKSKQSWKVQERNKESCKLVKIMYQNKSFYKQTIDFIEILQKYYNKQVNKLVTDWIIDTNNRYFLLDVKEIELIQAKPKFRISKSLTELLSTVTCSMCLQTCHQSQISKVLTNKLITHFYQHITKRGITLSFRINFKKITNLSRVCDLCYSIVVAQTKLIQVQEKIGQICHYQSNAHDSCHRKTYENMINIKIQNTQYLLKQKMSQWRLFFYIQDIQDFFNILSKNKIKQNQTTLYLYLKIDSSETYFQLKCPFQNNLQIKAIKIEHIFSENLDIREYLQKVEVKIQIFSSLSAIRPIAQGSIHGIFNQDYHYSYGNGNPNSTLLQRKYKQILLFNQQSKYSVLGLYIGICNDGMVNTYGIELNKNLGIYKASSQFTNCLSLPAEWMEIIHENYNEKFQSSNHVISSYSQFCQFEGKLDGKSKSKSKQSQMAKLNLYSINQNKSKLEVKNLGISKRQPSISLHGGNTNNQRARLVL